MAIESTIFIPDFWNSSNNFYFIGNKSILLQLLDKKGSI